ncbi:DJ-1/PfpI family protein [Bacillus tianshenii]|nr:DJ-1/PfpI family protein [Bacillus tianshenii]
MNVQIVLFDGFDELDAIAPFEVLKRGNEAGAKFNVKLVSLHETEEVTAYYGLKIKPDSAINLNNIPDLLIVPGGGWNHRGETGARIEAKQKKLPKLIKYYYEQGSIIAGVCTGGMLMAVSGITEGRTTTMHHLAAKEMTTYGCEVIGARIVEDDRLLTARGVTSGVDLALWLIERFAGAPTAYEVEKRLEYERRGTVWRKS